MSPNFVAPDIVAFVHWKEPCVYAGEEIECTITFRNLARPAEGVKGEDGTLTIPVVKGVGHGARSPYMPSAVQSRTSSVTQVKATPPLSQAPSSISHATRGHRPTLSLNVSGAAGRRPSLQSASAFLEKSAPPNGTARPTKGHGRSLSIMSLGSERTIEGRTSAAGHGMGNRPVKVHTRSASLQHTPKLVSHTPAGLAMPALRQPSPLYETTTPPVPQESQSQSLRPSRRRPGTVSADHTPQLARHTSLRKQTKMEPPDPSFINFKFPRSEPTSQLGLDPSVRLTRSPATMHSSQKATLPPRTSDGWSSGAVSLNPITRVMSETSNDETSRTSSEFYSMSNESDETLASELALQQQMGNTMTMKPHSRQPSRSPHSRSAEPVTLMMAWAQTKGHFTLDGSLVNAAPFEEVKRKGIQSGGGVVGVERSKRSSSLFGALSWGNIGESLGGLLGADELSTMAQMKASVGSKTIPLLSTPQSLLFVDLQLSPGESKSFHYRFLLPRGLPPSHKGRAMKVSYHLSLGVQRPEDQTVKHVEIPFRVLGSYSARGDFLGHDLMSPYVLLQDDAHITTVSSDITDLRSIHRQPKVRELKGNKPPTQGLEDFLRYTERLLGPASDTNGVLLSPTSPISSHSLNHALSRQVSLADLPPGSVREAIDAAILRSNLVQSSENPGEAQAGNRFNISRSGQRVAVLTMLRPAYRLGEAVTGIVDFTTPMSLEQTQVSAYSVLLELESAEQVDPSIALRSSHSIHRVTRKVHASLKENAFFAKQVSFNLGIPVGTAPTFETTGVSLEWRLKIEFTTQRQTQGLAIDTLHGYDEDLLEELGSDERGRTLIAKERLLGDTFEIVLPLKVYGAASIDTISAESGLLFV